MVPEMVPEMVPGWLLIMSLDPYWTLIWNDVSHVWPFVDSWYILLDVFEFWTFVFDMDSYLWFLKLLSLNSYSLYSEPYSCLTIQPWCFWYWFLLLDYGFLDCHWITSWSLKAVFFEVFRVESSLWAIMYWLSWLSSLDFQPNIANGCQSFTRLDIRVTPNASKCFYNFDVWCSYHLGDTYFVVTLLQPDGNGFWASWILTIASYVWYLILGSWNWVFEPWFVSYGYWLNARVLSDPWPFRSWFR